MADHIQIGDISPRIQFTGDGAQTLFTYPFPIFKDADLKVYEDTTLKTLTTDYTVSGAGNSAGGSVTFLVAPANGVVVTLKRNIAIQRTSDFQESGEFRSKVINDELDTLTAALQQVDDGVTRSLRLGATDTAASLELPDKATRASAFLAFDANGDPIASDAAGPQGPQGPAGNMDGANNLSELTVLATARANMGLGSAAVENVAAGGASDLLRADGDGSNLTGIATGATDAQKANIILNSFRIAINGGLSVQNMVDGVVDEFEDETGVDLPTSTNENYDATGDYYTSEGLDVLIDASGETKIGDFTANGGLAAAFDKDLLQTAANGATRSGDTAGPVYLGIDWGVGNTKTISKMITVAPTNNNGHSAGAEHTVTYDIIGHTSNAPGSATNLGAGDDRTMAADSSTDGLSYETVATDTDTDYRYHWVKCLSAYAGASWSLCEVQFYELGANVDMTLVSNAVTALAQPDEAFIVLWQEDVDAVTLNTDLTAEVSRDGGTTWTAITLIEEAALTTGRILTGSADISAQPAGTSMKYRIKTLNTKGQRIHGVGLQWS